MDTKTAVEQNKEAYNAGYHDAEIGEAPNTARYRTFGFFEYLKGYANGSDKRQLDMFKLTQKEVKSWNS